MTENEPTSESSFESEKDPVESARKIYAGYLAEARDGEHLEARAQVSAMGEGKSPEDFIKMPLDVAKEAAEAGDVLDTVMFLEMAKIEEKEQWGILAQALEESARSAERMAEKAKGKRAVIIPALRSGAEKDRERAEILRQAIEKLKGE